MKAAKVFFALALCFALALPQALAADMWEKAESDVYKEKTFPMLGRGLLNVVSSPVDLLVQTVDKTKDGPPFLGTLGGLATGAGCTVLRAGSGVVDTAFFWVPSFNGFPVSRSFHNCLETDEVEAVEVIETTTLIAEPAPIVTVTDDTVTTPKRKVRDPYKYVKK